MWESTTNRMPKMVVTTLAVTRGLVSWLSPGTDRGDVTRSLSPEAGYGDMTIRRSAVGRHDSRTREERSRQGPIEGTARLLPAVASLSFDCAMGE